MRRIRRDKRNRRRTDRRELRNGCSGKKRYQSLQDAQVELKKLLMCHPRVTSGTAYLCQKCNKLHISRSKLDGWVCEAFMDNGQVSIRVNPDIKD